jgi:hypothetical protein
VDRYPTIDDEDLATEALAADPNSPVPDGAVPFSELTGTGPTAVLPQWYMPAPMGAPRFTGWRRRLARGSVALIIASFVMINAAGLCNTYGQLHL